MAIVLPFSTTQHKSGTTVSSLIAWLLWFVLRSLPLFPSSFFSLLFNIFFTNIHKLKNKKSQPKQSPQVSFWMYFFSLGRNRRSFRRAFERNQSSFWDSRKIPNQGLFIIIILFLLLPQSPHLYYNLYSKIFAQNLIFLHSFLNTQKASLVLDGLGWSIMMVFFPFFYLSSQKKSHFKMLSTNTPRLTTPQQYNCFIVFPLSFPILFPILFPFFSPLSHIMNCWF